MQHVLATNSDLVFVWHDNSGQTFPENSKHIQTKVSPQGFTINIAENAELPEPIIILCSSANGNKAQNVINIGNNAQVQLIEYMMSDDSDANNNVTTTINCNNGSHLKHCILQQAKEDSSITQQLSTTINQSADTKVASNIFTFGGGLSRIELAIAFRGQNSECNASSLAFTNRSETQDVLLKVDHYEPHCTSKSVARGVLKDESHTNFVGKIIVHPGAKKTYADLQIKNMLCSNKAQADNKPELEIYNNDVHCSHGSSTGQMNEDALFYMRSRGLDLETAKAMLIQGFIQPAIVSCTIPMVADLIKGIISER